MNIQQIAWLFGLLLLLAAPVQAAGVQSDRLLILVWGHRGSGDRQQLRKAARYFGIILLFALGAGLVSEFTVVELDPLSSSGYEWGAGSFVTISNSIGLIQQTVPSTGGTITYNGCGEILFLQFNIKTLQKLNSRSIVVGQTDALLKFGILVTFIR